ncbi:MAG TPA: inositol monophosphatase [Armatimonadota bacterium]|jgi:fructose-1,6-bisphosphatase/inositol monophosphatase family enzyme
MAQQPHASLADPRATVDRLIAIQRRMRDHLLDQLRAQGEAMAEVAHGHDSDGDTIYRIDERGEEILFEECEAWGRETPFLLVAEGIPGDGRRPFPAGARPDDAAFILIVDPIDGTREIMYDKRSAWSLAGIAPNLGADTDLSDIEVAVQTELSTTRHLYSDTLWAIRGKGAVAERQNLVTREVRPYAPRPSRAGSIAHGFAAIVKFFPGSKVPAAQMEENIFDAVLGDPVDGNPLAFDDQYITTGGQLYELMVGHYRFVADLRPVYQGPSPRLLCCHPYDICTELIARELGCIVTDARGKPLKVKLDIREPVSWVGYANCDIHAEVSPALARFMVGYLQPEES